MSISWKNGKYQLAGIILYEGFLGEEKLVANYSAGKYGQKGYEHFSFRTIRDERDKIIYSYGEHGKRIKLSYLGTDTFKGDPCFKVRFPNNFMLYIIPKGHVLNVVDRDGKYSKTFRWEPNKERINGVDADCEDCGGDIESMALVRVYFLK